MDGFALRSADTTRATAADPVRLAVAGSVAAGQPPPTATPDHSAWEIMTGAAMPAPCDAVIPVERVERLAWQSQRIHVREPLRSGQNRRAAGEDFQVGDLMLAAGEAVSPQAIMALAAVGQDRVATRPMPRVVVITTGGELTASGPPDTVSRIRDVNGPYLTAMLDALRIPLVAHRSVGDDPDALRRELASVGGDCEIIITTGGVSAGRLDYVPAMLAQLGATVLFHQVAIRPGKPLLFARLPAGPLLFGLPGNPMAVAVGLRFFVLPAIRALLGQGRENFLPARAGLRGALAPRHDLFRQGHGARYRRGRADGYAAAGSGVIQDQPPAAGELLGYRAGWRCGHRRRRYPAGGAPVANGFSGGKLTCRPDPCSRS